jgi:hypothetical protein
MAIEDFRVDVGRLPNNLGELLNSDAAPWAGPYINDWYLLDPCEGAYRYLTVKSEDSYALFTRSSCESSRGNVLNLNIISPGSGSNSLNKSLNPDAGKAGAG